MICPRCHGNGKLHTRESNGFVFVWHSRHCPMCHGAGHITKRDLYWLREADVLSEMRMSIDYSMPEAARETGVDIVAYNDAEHGRMNPEPFIERLRQAGAT